MAFFITMVFVFVAEITEGSQLVSMAIAADAKHSRLDSMQDLGKKEQLIKQHDTSKTLPSSNITDECFYEVEAAERQINNLITTATADFAAFDWAALLSPMLRALEHVKENRIAVAQFLIQEYHHLLITKQVGSLFLCNDTANSTASGEIDTIEMATLSTHLHTLKDRCPETVLKNTSLAKLRDWVDLQTLVYECVVRGATPLHTTKERQDSMKGSTSPTPRDAETLQELDVNATYNQQMAQSIQFICESENRLEYLAAMSPRVHNILQEHCKDITHGQQVQLAVEKIKRVQPESGFGQDPSLAAKHNFRSYDTATYYQQGHHDWRSWGRRRRATKRNGRDDWKHSQCISESHPHFDQMFSNKVHDGCSSPVALGWENVITPACFSHDMCYDCAYEFEGHGFFCDTRFRRDIKNECTRKTPWYEVLFCHAQAEVMFIAVVGWGRIRKEKPSWCHSACAKSYWQAQTVDTFKALDPWYR